MDPFLIGVLIAVGGFLIFALYMAISNEVDKVKSKRKVVEYQNTSGRSSKNEIDGLISALYTEFFGSTASGVSTKEKKRALEYKAQEIAEIAKMNNIIDNQIQGITDSLSNLGICGVSQTHFYYEINSLNPKFAPIFYFSNELRIQPLLSCYESILESNSSNTNNSYYITNWENARRTIKNDLPLYRELYKCKNPFVTHRIPLSDICYFKVDGNVQYVSNVHGGGVNLQGAVTGALLAGGAAAVIGSRIGTETKTSIDKIDTRHIILVYKKGDKIVSHDLESKDVDQTLAVLKKLIPQKEESLAKFENQQKQQTQTTLTSKVDDLKQYKELLDLGIISQEEFDAKKKQILGL